MPKETEHKVYINEELRIRMRIIVKRLSNSIQESEIINWLGNFQKNDYDKALGILENLEYVTESELIDHYNERLLQLIEKYGKKRNFIIHGIGDYGKSGTLMAYYLKKSPNYKLIKDNCTFYEKALDFKYKKRANAIPENTVLVLLDDFLGSGKSLWKYYKTFLKPQLVKISEIEQICSLSIYHLDKAERFLSGIMPEVNLISTLKYQCFKSGKSPFGSKNQISYYRDFAYFYGKFLFSIESEGEVRKHPLGYNNSQALIIFPYNPPNNTLPIFWSSKFVQKFKKSWIPLYPRNQSLKISRAKSIRNTLAYELGLLKISNTDVIDLFYSGKGELEWKSYSYITSTDFRLFAYMRLKQQGRVNQVICEILGLTLNDVNEIIQIGIQKGIFDDQGGLSLYGKELYVDCLKSLKNLKNEVGRDSINYELKKINYLPKTFNGKNREGN